MNAHHDHAGDDPGDRDFGARLSAYLDGELSPGERAAVEQRLATDAAAALLLADLRALREAARTLPERAPQRDLWPAIARRLPPGHRTVAAGAPQRRPRRYALSLPQLAAAAVLLVAASSALTVWLTTRLQRPPAAPVRPPAGVTAGEVAASFAARRPDFADHQYERAVRELQAVFEQGRGAIDSTTLAALEKNLALLDAAVAQARQALRDNPDDAYLTAHLAGTMQRKLKLLRQASDLANPMI